MSDKQKNLIVRAITGIIFVAVMVLGILHPYSLIVLFAFITGAALWEYTGLVNNIKGVKVNRFISTIAGVYFFLSTAFSLINILAFQQNEAGQTTFDFLLPLSVFIFLWTNDTGAYVSGSLFGRHKLFPRISPGKSWEGSIGGGILVLVVAGFIGYFANMGATPHILDIPAWTGLGLVVVIFGTWGDLVESLFKRTLGIKDSGKILPGHGGMLDRFDSSLMAIPAAVVYLYTLTLIQG